MYFCTQSNPTREATMYAHRTFGVSLLTVFVDIGLVDPPQGDLFYLEDDDITTRTHYLAPGTLLYNKGYVDFATQLRATPRASQSVPNLASSGESGPPRTSAMDDLVHFWSSYSLPFDFDPSNADIPSISYFALRIAASEWQCCLDSLQYLTRSSRDLKRSGGNAQK
jgi:hypothetical protein